jgi:hypothetical protein
MNEIFVYATPNKNPVPYLQQKGACSHYREEIFGTPDLGIPAQPARHVIPMISQAENRT